jgi:transcriptional regulator with XRE-family HTH domain
VIDAFDQAFVAAIDDLNAGRLRDDPEHYLRTVPAARHAEFTRRLTALMAARGPADHDQPSAEAYDAALSAVAAGAGSAGILPGALRRLRKARGIERDTVIDALAAEYDVGPTGRDALRRHYHQLESGALAGPNIAHRLLRSLARLLDSDGEDFIAAARAVVRERPPLGSAPAMGRSAGDSEQRRPAAPAAGPRRIGPPDPDVELVERLFTGGPEA